LARVRSGNAAREIGDISAKRVLAFLDDNEVSHSQLLPLQTSLLQYAVEGSGGTSADAASRAMSKR